MDMIVTPDILVVQDVKDVKSETGKQDNREKRPEEKHVGFKELLDNEMCKYKNKA